MALRFGILVRDFVYYKANQPQRSLPPLPMEVNLTYRRNDPQTRLDPQDTIYDKLAYKKLTLYITARLANSS